MAYDVARQYIEDVMARYAELFDDPLPHKVGRTALAEQDEPPIVKWSFGRIRHLQAMQGESIGTEVQELELRIWGAGVDQDESESVARTLKNQLLLACRQVAQRSQIPEPIEFGDFDWIEESHTDLGRALEGSVSMRFAVPAQVFDEVTVLKAQVTEHADYDGNATFDETIEATNQFP